ncbi:MAG: hypothetical protein ACN6OD_07310, partial [Alcaligenes sp.]
QPKLQTVQQLLDDQRKRHEDFSLPRTLMAVRVRFEPTLDGGTRRPRPALPENAADVCLGVLPQSLHSPT